MSVRLVLCMLVVLVAPARAQPLMDRSVCGNHAIDGMSAERLRCAPCMPGRPCKCNGVPRTEECDGGDLGGATCVSLGYAGGTLRCTAQCKLDERGCKAFKPTKLREAGSVELFGAYIQGLVAAGSADRLAVAWIAYPPAPQLHLALFDAKLRAVGKDRTLGDYDRVGLVARKAGWLVAASTKQHVSVFPVARDGKVGAEVAAFDDFAVEFLVADKGGTLLGLRQLDKHGVAALHVVVLDDVGKPLGTPNVVFAAADRGPKPIVTVAALDDGWRVMRSSESAGTEIAKLDTAGKVASSQLQGSTGQGMRLVATTSGPGVMFVDPLGLETLMPEGASNLVIAGVDDIMGTTEAGVVIGLARRSEIPQNVFVVRDGVAHPVRLPDAPAAAVVVPFGAAHALAWIIGDGKLAVASWKP